MLRHLPRRPRHLHGGGFHLRNAITTASPHPLPAPGLHAPPDTRRLAVLWACAMALVYTLDIDWLLSHALFAWQGYRWVLRDHAVTETLLHHGGHNLSIAAWVAVLLSWFTAQARRSPLRRPLAGLLLSVLLSTLLVSWVKSWSNMDCPWDIDGLGGARPYLMLWDTRPAWLPDGRCFPAGHASGGYAWVALYHYFLTVRPEWRRRGLAVGLAAGMLFGIGQQLRGAHFFSHDLWTLALCWTVATLVHLRFARAPGP